MAEDAFALSPISARASLPSEEDYDAISQAFMETSRGRWFLGEYAKRNRNADTRMVLDAVERIEQTIAAQKQPAPDNGLTEALAAIRHAVGEAEAAATAAVQGLALEDHLTPVRNGARIIKEISWRWREIGADARICDLLDSQVGAIEGACEQISPAGTLAALAAAFDLLKARIGGFDDRETAAPPVSESPAPAPAAAAHDEPPAAIAETAPAASMADDTEAAKSLPAEAVVETAATVEATAEVVEVTAEATEAVADLPAHALDVASEVASENAEAADAYDEALLDMVALEMGAPDDAGIDDAADEAADEVQAAAPPQPAEPVIVAEMPAPPELQTSLQPAPEPPVEPSLGSTLLANGIVRQPNPAMSDPLAPIRRMSQAEKVAFFS